ncbi:GntR family transcriptional regulator [Rhizobiales bacterium]|uniref:GntR family transcriptional regulator n=1 Tax=Hongsoonwoonella zoysiae TaxID=2821844 RepID=UPI0015606DF6|nr:GntR family transcriptional regulator [Hongsoonwoonella zoysiae]NRG18348.1 GntR family transcriptional regulator [Hongsoonwoonella zoysiae]
MPGSGAGGEDKPGEVDRGELEHTLRRVVQRVGRPRTATAFLEESLRSAIVAGDIPGGTALRQEAVAEIFGVSRMPVREAIRQLEAQGLVEFQPHKGAVVAAISARDAADNWAIRKALECAALEYSIPGLTEQDIMRGEEGIAEMDDETDFSRLGLLNRRFHMTLYARAQFPGMLQLIEKHLIASDRYIRFQLAALGRDKMAQDDHRAILTAAGKGDAGRACRLLASHIEDAGRRLVAWLKTREG